MNSGFVALCEGSRLYSEDNKVELNNMVEINNNEQKKIEGSELLAVITG